MKKIAYLFSILFVSIFFVSCENEDWEFPDFEYQTVYFAHQYPVRTITLGEDIFDTTLDNEWKFQIMATTGGVYENVNDVIIDITVDNNLVNDLAFANGGEVLAMPGNYYSLASDNIIIPKGRVTGGVEVQLTEAFFADSLSIHRNYVIPVRMTNVQQADSILVGEPLAGEGRRTVAGDWAVQPKDFVLYAVKYINRLHGYYLRRGEDVIVGNNGNSELDQTIVRSEEFVEDDEVVMLATQSLNEVLFSLTFKASDETDIDVPLILSFDEEGNITVRTNSNDFTVTGSGEFVKDGEVNSWGNQDRDAIYLNYEVELENFSVSSSDTLVLRNRGVEMELFTPVLE
ncbi:DUF5627 domain-containing protein [Antarcticibacterium sp. 1MA-6-2]|uniref:DUF5627 domain-containing protein n=1 Tax=Antarcticibacterium sp. 1MA-6-2 TaxID=2908210 RepID=UPI001F4594C6|nr:DUF5627 domain-containing protein [Antarcticibacterium sp. 1MA-6-2]UJH90791.1 DUF5627 domain-containing protein [Antarcticibacterium sp. 1MA-6-2]